MNRSYLFVPGDSGRKFSKAAESAADALIVDLEDSVAAAQKPAARKKLADFLATQTRAELWVRINPLDSEDAAADLSALEGLAPAGIVLPKANGADDIRRLGERLASLEQRAGLERNSLKILPLVTERPAALFRMGEYASATERLAALTWGAEDLAAAIGAESNKDSAGAWLAPYQLARSLCLVAAAAAGVPAIETVYTDVRDTAGAADFARAARRDGFSGMLLVHPAQIAPVHDALTPDEVEIEFAEKVVARFDEDPDAGVVAIDGRMIDRPHYLQARRLLDIARRAGKR